jgi:hypothetical protein
MTTVAWWVTVAMITIIAKRVPVWLACESCGEDAMYFVESDEGLCAPCLAKRRSAFRAQGRELRIEAAKQQALERADGPRYERWLRWNFEGEGSSLDLARDGYFDVAYEEFVPSEFFGPRPRWETSVTMADRTVVSPMSLLRAVYALLVAVHVPLIRRSALRNCRIQLGEAIRVEDGFRDVVEMYDGTDDRDLGDDVMSWLHRDPSNQAILSRWNRDDDELAFMESIRDGSAFTHPGDRDAVDVDPEDEDLDDGEFEYVHGEEHRFGQRALSSGREGEWWELMVAFRRQKLHGLLQEYFGLDDYRAQSIVLKWEKSPSGRWKPAHQMNVVEWVEWSQEQAGSILGGLQSCTRSIQVKTQLRRRKEAAKARA